MAAIAACIEREGEWMDGWMDGWMMLVDNAILCFW